MKTKRIGQSALRLVAMPGVLALTVVLPAGCAGADVWSAFSEALLTGSGPSSFGSNPWHDYGHEAQAIYNPIPVTQTMTPFTP